MINFFRKILGIPEIITKTYGDTHITADEATYVYILKLQQKLDKMEREKDDAQAELVSIKPMLENRGLKPAISRDCMDCKYAVWSNDMFGNKTDVIGCRKDNVCIDFEPVGKGE